MEEVYLEIERSELEFIKWFDNLFIQFDKLKEDNNRLDIENNNLALRISALETLNQTKNVPTVMV